MLRNAMGGGGSRYVKCPDRKLYEGVMFNVMGVTRRLVGGWVGGWVGWWKQS